MRAEDSEEFLRREADAPGQGTRSAASPRCWVCGAEAAPERLEIRDADRGTEVFHLERCPACRSGRISDPPSQAALSRYYSPDYYGRGDGKFAAPLQYLVDAGVRRRARALRQAMRLDPCPTVVEIGCGRGVLLRELVKLGVRGIGLEREGCVPASDAATFEVRHGELEEFAVPDASIDAVILWHVLEHLADPARTLPEIARILKPGGLLVLAVPNTDSWQARRFERHWFHEDAPRHLHGFGHRGLLTLLPRMGFEVHSASTTDLVQNTFGFVQSTLNLLPGAGPNRLYQLMRSAPSLGRILRLLLWLVPAAALLPVALLELAWSAARGRGACSVMMAIRR